MVECTEIIFQVGIIVISGSSLSVEFLMEIVPLLPICLPRDMDIGTNYKYFDICLLVSASAGGPLLSMCMTIISSCLVQVNLCNYQAARMSAVNSKYQILS